MISLITATATHRRPWATVIIGHHRQHKITTGNRHLHFLRRMRHLKFLAWPRLTAFWAYTSDVVLF